VAFFFDGPFIWRQKQNMLEFTFTKVSAGVSGEYTYSRDIQAGDWKTVGVDTDTEVSKAQKPGKTPFFKFIHVDERCIVARGRGGGLAVWGRISSNPVQAAPGSYEKVAL
jgi:hypothetical protein